MKLLKMAYCNKTLKPNSNIPFYAVIITIFILLKAGFALANNDDLLFLLKPMTKLLEMLTGTVSVYHVDSGFFFAQLGIVVDKSCSGGNFMLLSFAMLSFLALNNLAKAYQKLWCIPVLLLIAYLGAIGVNVSRIYVALIAEPKIKELFDSDFWWLHEAIGVTTNLSFLILIYIVFNKLLQSYSYEKLA